MKFYKRQNGGVYDYSNHLWIPISQNKIAICPKEGTEPLPLNEWLVVNESFQTFRPCGTKILTDIENKTMKPKMAPRWVSMPRDRYLNGPNHQTGLVVLDPHMIVSPNVSMVHDERILVEPLKHGKKRVRYQGVDIQLPFDPTKLNRSHFALNFDEHVPYTKWHMQGMWLMIWQEPYLCHPETVKGVIPGIEIVALLRHVEGSEFCNFAPSKEKRVWRSKHTKTMFDLKNDKTACVELYFYLRET